MNRSRKYFVIKALMLISLISSSLQSYHLPLSGNVQVVISHDAPQEQLEQSPTTQHAAVWLGAAVTVGFILWKIFGGPKVPRVLRALMNYHPGDDDAPGTLGIQSDVVYLDVAHQAGADCGFHAVGNGAFLYNMLTVGNNNQLSNNQLNNLFNDLSVFDLARYRARMREEFGVTSWLQDDEVDSLAHHEAGLNPNSYVVIPNIRQFNPVQADADRYIKILNDLRTRNGATYIFLIGNMGEYRSSSGAISGSRGHWISVVVQRRENRLVYYVMDSLGGRRDSMIASLRALVERIDIDRFQQACLAHFLDSAVQRITNTALRLADEERVDGALKALENIKRFADQFALYNNQSFQSSYAKPIAAFLNQSLIERAEKYPEDFRKYPSRAHALLKAFTGLNASGIGLGGQEADTKKDKDSSSDRKD